MITFLYILVIYFGNIHCNELYPSYTTLSSDAESSHTDLVRGSSVDKWVGSEQVVYCKLVSPRGIVSFDNFGRCRLSLDRVGLEHQGYWSMYVGYPDQPTFEQEYIYLNVIGPENETQVDTLVEESSPMIMIVTCSLRSGYQVRGCKFRGPNNTTVIASGTTGIYDRFESYLKGSKCIVRITNPTVSDLGFWRCAMYTEHNTYFGFFTVLSSWLMHETSVVDSIRRGPMLRVDGHWIANVYEGEPVTVSCSIDAPIKYCYFWMFGGTVFTVYPGLKSSSMEYVGSGFNAGECGLKINSSDLSYTINSGEIYRQWRCFVGLNTGVQQNRGFGVIVQERMQANQRDHGSRLMGIYGFIANGDLEYCRFVQDSGFGFSHDNTPSGYNFTGSLSEGRCFLQISSASSSDYSPWTIVAKVKREDGEMSRTTSGLPLPSSSSSSFSFYFIGWEALGWMLLGIVTVVVLIGLLMKYMRWKEDRYHRQPPLINTPTTPIIHDNALNNTY